ncbi:hypothetical protein ABBQ38_015125 [Trebouxia sp. C0009 RCD-2024]
MPNKFVCCARQQAAAILRGSLSALGTWPSPQQLPIVYHDAYNVSFLGLENLHVFDSKKFKKVVSALEQKKMLSRKQLVTPSAATEEVLLDVHTSEYLQQLKTSRTVAEVTELAILACLPNVLLQWRVVKPMRYMVAGTMLAAALALERGWSINIGGGMHHAHSGGGAGWCMFSDLTLALRKLRQGTRGMVNNVLVIDTDAHQGNGYERDKLKFQDDNLYILDIYNADLWPCDRAAKTAIDNMTELTCGTKDVEYLRSLKSALQRAAKEIKPDVILYNAGTDVLTGDPLGRMAVSLEGVVQRDEMVFEHALRCKCPITMVLSGGYATDSHQVVTASIENLMTKFDLVLAN